MSQKPKQSSTILNLLIIIFGLFFAFVGILDILTGSFGLTLPGWLASTYASINDPAVLALLGNAGWTTTALGVWAVIAGVALFAEEEWALGQTLVILSLMAINSIPTVISLFMTSPIVWGSVYLWVYLVIAIVSVVGFIYLLVTSKRYH
jgi:hypothetical protein